jgi:hypothetical protein
MLNAFQLWRDKRGRLSVLRIVTLAVLCVPGRDCRLGLRRLAPAGARGRLEFDPEMIRPGWLVLASGFAVVLLELVSTR